MFSFLKSYFQSDEQSKEQFYIDVFVNAGNIEVMEKYKISINSYSTNGFTALSQATFRCDFKLVKYLVENGANVNLTSADRLRPLQLAVIKDRLDIVKYLVENGADVNLTEQEDLSPLYIATFKNLQHIRKYLIKNGASMDSKKSK